MLATCRRPRRTGRGLVARRDRGAALPSTGVLRRSEVAALHWADVELAAATPARSAGSTPGSTAASSDGGVDGRSPGATPRIPRVRRMMTVDPGRRAIGQRALAEQFKVGVAELRTEVPER